MKTFTRFFTLFLIFLIPVSIFTSKFINFDTVSAVIFLVVVLILIYRYRDKLELQSMIKILQLPILYVVLWKMNFGLKLMDKIAKKYRELVKLIGYTFIGLGFTGMIFVSVMILNLLYKLFITPREASQAVAVVLPFTNIPGIGFLSFWHFLITIFITMLIHEFAHGIVARAHDVPVKSSGLGVLGFIVPIFPLAFVEPDEKVLSKKSDVIQYSIFAAGPIINVLFAGLIVLILSFVIIPIGVNITHPIGFTFSGVLDNYSAQEAGLEPGMIINSVNGVEVLDYLSFANEISGLEPGHELAIGTTNGTFTLITKASPDNPNKGYIGILAPWTNEVRLNNESSIFGSIYFWIKGLFKWLWQINLMIGLINLLPLILTDGGRMLKIASEKIITNKKKARKIVAVVSSVFIFTILFAMFLRYVFFNFFS